MIGIHFADLELCPWQTHCLEIIPAVVPYLLGINVDGVQNLVVAQGLPPLVQPHIVALVDRRGAGSRIALRIAQIEIDAVGHLSCAVVGEIGVLLCNERVEFEHNDRMPLHRDLRFIDIRRRIIDFDSRQFDVLILGIASKIPIGQHTVIGNGEDDLTVVVAVCGARPAHNFLIFFLIFAGSILRDVEHVPLFGSLVVLGAFVPLGRPRVDRLRPSPAIVDVQREGLRHRHEPTEYRFAGVQMPFVRRQCISDLDLIDL
ncbi:hypothetical protein LDX61_08300 [Bifidobacterium pseudolongum]|uniref:hypothetical protein n=1 Tax=Bifidobacterium pseudolongum TaxID=1694 RepID=UPI001CE11742|nr:hypothetical protein [Bifidobacterium pseudolongum]UBY94264.1 hypothetical protein LDX61_08300 [Bifidobacterium pseudolongum]UBZ03097.1 hypothetical protein LDH93_08300 [Bifidobacterium pseudolongum]UBZ04670.1 hypothetical protein LDX67_08300 [Bifidobacterium pseudolongum]UDL23682.1 hypothetical protein LJD78_08305 [Bifidobacterium pseudolongum]